MLTKGQGLPYTSWPSVPSLGPGTGSDQWTVNKRNVSLAVLADVNLS